MRLFTYTHTHTHQTRTPAIPGLMNYSAITTHLIVILMENLTIKTATMTITIIVDDGNGDGSAVKRMPGTLDMIVEC